MNDSDNSSADREVRELVSYAWKHQCPYLAQANFDVKHEGSCHCGRVKYQLSRDEPLDVKMCHCTTCQVLHAAPFQWAAIFQKTDINFLNGHRGLEWYDTQTKKHNEEHILPCKVRCKSCHTPIMDEGRNMLLMYPTLIHRKFPDEFERKFKPRCHIFYEQRVIDVNDGATKWTGLDKYSVIMEERKT